MAQIFYYKLTSDNGGAPCVQDDLLSLAICKPMIRAKGKPGDLIFGFAANSLHADNRLLYVARVTAEMPNGAYYTTAKFAHRADCIYERRDGRFVWRAGALHHGPNHVGHDLGKHPRYEKANVLLSDDFRYFGYNGDADYKVKYPLIKDAVEGLGRGHRVHHHKRLRLELERLTQQVWKKTSQTIAGMQTSKPRRDACHRSRSCGVLGDK